jgi:hypothetical protein
MNISGYIHTLLKFNECVIIPDFGGFISSYVPARFDRKKNVFLPPSKEITFNSKIVKNDGLLINHIVEKEGIGYHDARIAIDNWVENTMKTLYDGNEVSFEGAGSLRIDRNGSFIYTPGSDNKLTDAFGLEELNVKHIALSAPKEIKQRPAVRAISYKTNIGKVAAGIAILVTLSLIPVRKGNFDFSSSVVNTPALIKNAEVAKSDIQENENVVAEVTSEVVSQPEVKPYILVGGSFQYYENAHNFEIELRINGHHPEIIKQDNGLFKVAIDSYTDKQLALDAMKLFRDDHPNINAWVSRR